MYWHPFYEPHIAIEVLFPRVLHLYAVVADHFLLLPVHVNIRWWHVTILHPHVQVSNLIYLLGDSWFSTGPQNHESKRLDMLQKSIVVNFKLFY